MSRKRHIEVDCDGCGCAIDYFNGDNLKEHIDKILEAQGVIVEGRKDFCDENCRQKYLEKGDI